MNKISVIICLLLSLALRVHAQRVDEAYHKHLLHASQIARSDEQRILAYQALGDFYNNRFIVNVDTADLKKALDILGTSINIAARANNPDLKFEGMRLKANTYMALGDTINAIDYINPSLKYFEAKLDFTKFLAINKAFAKTAYRSACYEIALSCYQSSISLIKHYKLDIPLLPLQSEAILTRAGVRQTKAEMDNAAKLIKENKGKQNNLAMVYYYLAYGNRFRGDIKTALHYALATLRDVEAFNDTVNNANAYAELAQIYEVLGKTEQSIYFYKKTLAARDKMLIRENYKYRTLGFMVKGLIILGRPGEALKEVVKYESAHPPASDEGKAYCMQNKAYCYDALGQYAEAENLYARTIQVLSKKDQRDEIRILAYYDISKFYVKTGNYLQAKLYASKLKKSNVINTKNFESLYYKIDSAFGNYKSSLMHYAKYQRAKDSLFSESKSKEIAELQFKYETAQKEADIKMLKKDAQQQRIQLKQSDHIRNITFAGVALLMAAMGLLYNSYRINIGKTKEINEKNSSLSAMVEEKEWLMKEIHHRVKNNLQIVMGLLQRQSAYINNTAALKAIRNSEHRIHAIALIHQKLYQSEDLALINMQEYIEELLNHLKETTDAEGRIVFIKNLEEVYLHVAQAVPLGLIINEAVTNAIKYAYPNGKQGSIRVTFSNKAEAKNELVVEDNGVGISGEITNKSMGMNLMRGLTKQLGGTFNFTHTEGVSIRIVFKNEHLEPQEG